MAQTADFPSREPAYQILREGARLCLELPPRTLRSRAALLYERIYESLMPLKKVKEHPRCRVALDTANTPCAEHAGARHREPDFTPHASHFRLHHPHARAVNFAPTRVGAVRMYTDLGLSPPTFAGRFRMVNRRRTWGTGFPDIRGHGRAIWQREHSAPRRLPIDDSLVPLLKVKERHRRRIAQDTAITLYAEHAGARHQADFTSDACRFGVHLAHARCLRLAYASRVCASRCTDLYGKCAVSVRFCTVLVCQANWQKVGGGSPPIRRPDGATFLREPCAGPRERAGEASVAVRMGRAIEQRNHIRSGCHCFQFG